MLKSLRSYTAAEEKERVNRSMNIFLFMFSSWFTKALAIQDLDLAKHTETKFIEAPNNV